MLVIIHYCYFLFIKGQNTSYPLNNIQKDIELTVDYLWIFLL